VVETPFKIEALRDTGLPAADPGLQMEGDPSIVTSYGLLALAHARPMMR